MDGQTRYRRWYRRLLGLYPRPYRERFADSMEQTFTDLCRERAGTEGRGHGALILWIFTETFAGIIRERATDLARWTMARNATNVYRIVKYLALAVGGLMVAGIATVMVLARGTGEDIAGVVAPALLLTLLSVVAAVVAAILQGASDRRRHGAGDDLAG
ncbi:hypothetical protein [Micromonospora parathelypteridis]|uniref:DUF2975 domain-containing protein n=1 Tax=Micromonospora parathelypteridis TaxID=1839617 RepID=A0A840VJJ6_9ACTN|nr:hypothetical protein [Micromonospora parathelypteridis]MBB5476046.1 hypothetical protein [Micromonospora parathelypteridis]GGO32545.1 hypothetical protein GCM10011576_63060 [Micromonospora parathelypteridis]